jgi:hypothetical protein
VRLRLVKLLVQPVVVADDGEHLTELATAQVSVDAAEVERFPEWLAQMIAERERELNADPE